MARTRSMTRNQKNDDTSSLKRIKTCDNSTGVVPWSDLDHGVLCLVMTQLGFVDFLVFSGVCKSWRSIAFSNRNRFMASKAPMSICISANVNGNKCCLTYFKGRRFKTTLPHSASRTCVGLTCGYLMLFGEKSKDFWLVNPITSHELHFPVVPFDDNFVLQSFRAILVFSPSISEWVFVLLPIFSDKIWFCIAGKREWTEVSTPFRIHDLHAFKGKIYILHFGNHISEVRVYPTPKVTLVETKNFPKADEAYMNQPVFVSSGETLYVIDLSSKHAYKIQEINCKMEWVSCEKIGEEYELFLRDLKHGIVKRVKSGADLHSQYTFTDKSGKGKFFYEKIW